MPARKKLDSRTETDVLVRSGRRCCLCFHLQGDGGVKNGQIAHLDKDRTNDADDNLAFLCLDHHSEYDSITSQNKGLTKPEVKVARSKLYAYIERGFPTFIISLSGRYDQSKKGMVDAAVANLRQILGDDNIHLIEAQAGSILLRLQSSRGAFEKARDLFRRGELSELAGLEVLSVREPKNIVLCLDGTGDWLGTGKTNVAQIYDVLDKEKQACFYDGGIGTLTDPKALSKIGRMVLKLLDLGAATSLREKSLNAYIFLVRNYEPGDRIYMFGFSRGAMTARLVAAIAHNMGVLRPENEHLAAYVWQNISSVGDKAIGVFKRTANRIKNSFSTNRKALSDDAPGIRVDITFMGLFDSVSSVGVIGRFNTYPNTDHNDSVLRVCHGVAIDEQRNV
ncbi:MAG: DUF2235 domain-containing protein, partial [Chlorobia bacterium]|nr:DUF2235 domain-containing protein [Fimbriimonadaceae bacterium]